MRHKTWQSVKTKIEAAPGVQMMTKIYQRRASQVIKWFHGNKNVARSAPGVSQAWLQPRGWTQEVRMGTAKPANWETFFNSKTGKTHPNPLKQKDAKNKERTCCEKIPKWSPNEINTPCKVKDQKSCWTVWKMEHPDLVERDFIIRMMHFQQINEIRKRSENVSWHATKNQTLNSRIHTKYL